MRKGLLLIMMAALLLPWNMTTGLASTEYMSIVDLNEIAPDRWTQTYEAHGRTVAVDIAIHVPETTSFPVIQAEPMPMLASIPNKGEKSNIIGDYEIWAFATSFRVDTPISTATNAARRENREKVSPDGYNAYPVIKRFDTFDMDMPYAFNNVDTVNTVQASLENMWATYYPNDPMTLIPHWINAYKGNYKYNRSTDTYSGEPWPYFQATLMVYFDQAFYDIPLITSTKETFTRYAGTKKSEDKHNSVLGAIGITMGLEDIGLDTQYQSLQYHLLREKKMIAEDVPLCSFETVKATYEGLIEQGLLRSVTSMRLGYVAWLNDDAQHTYTLMPMWVVEGELYEDANAEDRVGEKTYDTTPTGFGSILVNAQTGEWIEPWSTKNNRSFQTPTLLKWK